MKNETVLFNLKNVARFVEVTDKATGKTENKRKIVKLRSSDFGDAAVAKLYKSRVLAVANAVNAFCAKDSDDKAAEFKAVLTALSGVYDFFRVNCGMDEYKARNSEVRFLLETATRHKFTKVAEGEEATLDRIREGKSVDGLRGDIEEVIYYRMNGFALPTFSASASVVKANARAADDEAKAKAAAQKDAEKAKRDATAKATKAKAAKATEKAKAPATTAA